MKKRITKVLTAAAVTISSIPQGVVPSAAEKTEPLKVMCVGDSITDGYWTQGGYRKYLSMQLRNMGYSNIDLVGPKGSDTEKFVYNGSEVEYDGNYAGYSGYAIQYMTGTETRQGILETLQEGDLIAAYSPDIVLLQIGTNDILSAYNEGITDRLENLIDYILSRGSEDELVYVTTIPDIDAIEVNSWLWAYGDVKWSNTEEDFAKIVQGYIDSYNSSINTLVTKMQGEGKNVRFADIHSVVDVSTDLYDGVHPNENGYEKMGSYWAATLDSYLSGTQQPEVSTTTTTATITTTTTTASTTTTTTVPDQHTGEELVSSLSSYILGRPDSGITAENWKEYDLEDDGIIDIYDLTEARRLAEAGKVQDK